MSVRQRSRGFTLLEIIVVIGIFAVFAAMAYGGLDTVLKARVRIDEGVTRAAEYDRAYLRLRNDFQNAASRSIRSAEGEPLPAFFFDTYTKRVEFTRAGWQNLLGLPRSTFERVSYLLTDAPEEGSTAKASLDDQRLLRRSWLLLDRAPQTQPIELTLLTHISELNLRFLDASGNWSDGWPASGVATGTPTDVSKQPPPAAVELKLRTRDWGDLRFVFQVGAEGAAKLAEAATLPPPNPNQNQNCNPATPPAAPPTPGTPPAPVPPPAPNPCPPTK